MKICYAELRLLEFHFSISDLKFLIIGNKEDEELEKNVDKEININNVDIRRDAENDNPNGGNGIKEEKCDKVKYSIRNNGYEKNYEEKKA
ncbi:hypothetical protein FQA39_LY05794 [Lamprigera yunnana]|nr:hypothetical protein FQA39_LY05794 [Lamprigera yunnana]